LRRAAVDGEVETGSLMAGQSVGLVGRVQPLREILAQLVTEADQGLAAVEARLAGRRVPNAATESRGRG